MENKTIVTIGRQFGSGGREIGQLVANKLGVKCYDRTLITLTAKASGFDEATLESLDEKSRSALFVPIPVAHYANLTGNFEYTLNDKIFFVQSEIIRKIAQEESAVIVGRCADYVLEGRDNVLRVFIKSSDEARIERIMERQYIDRKSATALIAKTDKKRASYYKFYTGKKWAAVENYDLILDSSLGFEKVADIIISALKK